MKRKKARVFNPKTLKHFRVLKGLTQADLAELLNISSRTVRNWEGGHAAPSKGKNTKTINIHDVAKSFEVDADVFYLTDEEFTNLVRAHTSDKGFKVFIEKLERFAEMLEDPVSGVKTDAVKIITIPELLKMSNFQLGNVLKLFIEKGCGRDIYIFKNPVAPIVKIGKSYSVEKRLYSLNHKNGLDLQPLLILKGLGTYYEKWLHSKFLPLRLTPKREWFEFRFNVIDAVPSLDEKDALLSFIKTVPKMHRKDR